MAPQWIQSMQPTSSLSGWDSPATAVTSDWSRSPRRSATTRSVLFPISFRSVTSSLIFTCSPFTPFSHSLGLFAAACYVSLTLESLPNISDYIVLLSLCVIIRCIFLINVFSDIFYEIFQFCICARFSFSVV